MNPVTNFLLFQVGWFSSVISASLQLQWLAIILIAVLIGFHIKIVPNPAAELKIIIIAGITGLVVDTVLIHFQVLVVLYPESVSIAPPWLIGLWMLFGITVNHSLRWFNQHMWLAALGGLIFAPLAYWAGDRFGLLEFSTETDFELTKLFVIGICWFFITPMLLMASRKLIPTAREIPA